MRKAIAWFIILLPFWLLLAVGFYVGGWLAVTTTVAVITVAAVGAFALGWAVTALCDNNETF